MSSSNLNSVIDNVQNSYYRERLDVLCAIKDREASKNWPCMRRPSRRRASCVGNSSPSHNFLLLPPHDRRVTKFGVRRHSFTCLSIVQESPQQVCSIQAADSSLAAKSTYQRYFSGDVVDQNLVTNRDSDARHLFASDDQSFHCKNVSVPETLAKTEHKRSVLTSEDVYLATRSAPRSLSLEHITQTTDRQRRRSVFHGSETIYPFLDHEVLVRHGILEGVHAKVGIENATEEKKNWCFSEVNSCFISHYNNSPQTTCEKFSNNYRYFVSHLENLKHKIMSYSTCVNCYDVSYYISLKAVMF